MSSMGLNICELNKEKYSESIEGISIDRRKHTSMYNLTKTSKGLAALREVLVLYLYTIISSYLIDELKRHIEYLHLSI